MPPDTQFEICCHLNWEHWTILNGYFLNTESPCDPNACESPLKVDRSSCHPHWSLSVVLRIVGLMGSYSGAAEIHHDVRYFTDKHLDPINMWNIDNSIHSIRSYINTTTNLFSKSLHILHSLTVIGSLWSLSTLSSTGERLTIQWLVGIT